MSQPQYASTDEMKFSQYTEIMMNVTEASNT